MKKNKILRIVVITFVMILYLYAAVYTAVPNRLTMIEGKEISYPFYDFITISFEKEGNVKTVGNSLISSSTGSEKVKLSLFGIIPLKTIDVHVIADNVLIGGGDIIGMKLNTEGLTVVSFEGFTTRDYTKAKPYEGKNIQRGDIITKINDKKITKVNDFVEEIQASHDKEIQIEIFRNNNIFIEKFNAEIDRNDGKYKLGIWVKNTTSGVGTVTYINPGNNSFGALGHGINDIDEMNLLKINGGEAYKAMVLSVNKGKKGIPGEIRGAMRENDVYGEITKNTKCGVFGYLDNGTKVNGSEYEIGLKNEVAVGDAKILCTISGKEKKEYKIRIEKINYSDELDVKNMVIKVIDKELISMAGGIVQGMSGSPIIQNGKLVGAVTHVLINDPSRGYGIFIENMLSEEVS